MATSSSQSGSEKQKPWWLSSKKIGYKLMKEARILIATHEQSEIVSALNLLDSALAMSPKFELALELKARSLLCLRRYKEIADMLQDYIPSLKMCDEDSSSSPCADNSCRETSKDRVKLLNESSDCDSGFKCFSVSELKKKVMAGIWKNSENQGHWRYLVLGQACCHLGLMEDALVLLQTGKRMAMATLRRHSISMSDDKFTFDFSISNKMTTAINSPSTLHQPRSEIEKTYQLISQIKILVRRKTAALAALDAGHYSEAIRHFSKIINGHRASPQAFLAECYMHRALAYKSTNRITESITDCNRSLALNPTCIQALSTRASLLETIRCLPDSLHDLEHMKLLYNSILRDRKLPGPAWKPQYVRYGEVSEKLCHLNAKIQELKQSVGLGEVKNVDYYSLIGLRRGCSRSELERAHLVLVLRHKPDKAMHFIERCEFLDDCDIDSVKDRARMSALILYRLLQKGFTNLMQVIMDEEAVERQRVMAAAALQATAIQIQRQQEAEELRIELEVAKKSSETLYTKRVNTKIQCENKGPINASVFQGVFCRDLATVGNLLSQVGFNRPLTLKYEALSC